jgi:hypothetical protein
MRCQSCDYPLWNLKARQCPECGAAFRPSEYEFTANSLRFCCPHCDHPYFGTSETGHPVPESFACLRCGRPLHIDEMVLRPGLGVEEAQTAKNRMPWLERKEIGFFKSWFMMIGYAMTRPGEVGRTIPPEASAFAAWLYCTVTLLIFAVIGLVFPQGFFLGVAGAGPWRNFSLAPLQTIATIIIWVVASVAAAGVLMWLWAVLAHGILRLSGKGAGPLRRTCHAVYYSAGAGVLTLVPCFGIMVGWIWWAVSATIMLKETQGVRTLRAACAILAAPVAVCVALLGLWVVTMAMAISGGFAGSGPATNQTTQLNWAIVYYASQNAGVGPEHAIELHTARQMAGFAPIGPGAFTFPDSQTTDADIPLADGSLKDFMNASRSEQFSAIAKMIDSMPKGVVAHRFGDYVFTYHGATPIDPKLWVVVMLPDPTCNPTPGPNDSIFIGMGSYQVTEVTFGELPELLKTQNQHRASLKLPPLPDLTTITHGKPAVAPAADDAQKTQEAQ